MSYPPKEAITVARLVLEKAYDGRNNGITYGGAGDAATSMQNFDIHKGAPAKLQGSADATWNMHTDLCGIIVTMFGGAIYHGTNEEDPSGPPKLDGNRGLRHQRGRQGGPMRSRDSAGTRHRPRRTYAMWN